MKQELIQSKVRFDEDNHRYYLGAMELSGITKRIHELLAPNMDYSFADTSIGTAAHNDIEQLNLTIIYGVMSAPITEHGKRYLEWYNGQDDLKIIASEYIVTDGAKYASPIDNVYRNKEDEIEIGDTKTYKTLTPLNRTMAQWQLSIYAHLFEQQNGFRPEKAFILHVTDSDVEKVYIELFDNESVIRFLYDDEFNPYELACENTTLNNVVSLSDILDQYDREKKAIEEQLEVFKAKMIEEMKANKFTKAEQGLYKFAIVAESKTERFDSKRFKEEHPDIYGQYTTESIRKEYLKITKSKSA